MVYGVRSVISCVGEIPLTGGRRAVISRNLGMKIISLFRGAFGGACAVLSITQFASTASLYEPLSLDAAWKFHLGEGRHSSRQRTAPHCQVARIACSTSGLSALTSRDQQGPAPPAFKVWNPNPKEASASLIKLVAANVSSRHIVPLHLIFAN